MKILWKGTVSAEFWAIRGKTLRKLCLSENFVKLWYFTQCIPLDQNQFSPPMPKLKLHLSNIAHKTENETSKPKNSD